MTTTATTKTARKVSPDKKSGKAVAGEVRPVAKSLHTLTVLLQVARLHMAAEKHGNAVVAMHKAMDTLGLAGRPDPYGLEAIALKQLLNEAAK